MNYNIYCDNGLTTKDLFKGVISTEMLGISKEEAETPLPFRIEMGYSDKLYKIKNMCLYQCKGKLKNGKWYPKGRYKKVGTILKIESVE